MPTTETITVNLSVAGQPVRIEQPVPTEPAPLESVLPLLRDISQLSQQVGVNHLPAGKAVSCRAGCGACCSQIVPVGRFEARQVAAVVDAMPEPRRSQVQDRFAEALRHFEEPHVLDRLRDRAALSAAERSTLAYDYFKANVPCPFLENGSCGIYEERPLRCREYLVTSPPEKCATPETEEIDGVDLPLYSSRAALRVEAKANAAAGRSGAVDWVPLVLALDEESPRPVKRPGVDWAADVLHDLGLPTSG